MSEPMEQNKTYDVAIRDARDGIDPVDIIFRAILSGKHNYRGQRYNGVVKDENMEYLGVVYNLELSPVEKTMLPRGVVLREKLCERFETDVIGRTYPKIKTFGFRDTDDGYKFFISFEDTPVDKRVATPTTTQATTDATAASTAGPPPHPKPILQVTDTRVRTTSRRFGIPEDQLLACLTGDYLKEDSPKNVFSSSLVHGSLGGRPLKPVSPERLKEIAELINVPMGEIETFLMSGYAWMIVDRVDPKFTYSEKPHMFKTSYNKEMFMDFC